MKKSVYLSSLLVICLSLFAVTAKAQIPVVTNPVHDTTCQMDTAWFTVTATGATPLTYVWHFSDDGGMSWDTVFNGGIYSGATTASLRVIPHVAQNGYNYRVLAFNTAGSDTSDWAMLTVDTLFAGVISGNVPVCVGSTVALSSSVFGGTWSNVNHTIDTVSPAGILEGRRFGRDTIKYKVMNTCGLSTSWVLSRVDTVVPTYPITGPTHVCVSNVINLVNANVIGDHVWSGMTGNTSQASTGAITGLTAGTDVITYAFSNACNSVTSYYNVTVEVAPAAGTITPAFEPPTFCAGSWMHYSASTSGGIWLSGSPSVATVNTSGDVTGLTQGTSIISYYKTNSCGLVYASDTVKVEVVAAPISGNDSVGIDSILVLTNTTPDGTWAVADTNIAKLIVAGTGTVKGRDTGITTVTYSVTNTCGSSSSTLVLNVGPLPNPGIVTGPDSVCVGAGITLEASVAGGTWVSKHDTLATVGPATPATDTTIRVTGVEFGRDTILYYVTTAFGRSVVRKPVFVNEPPVITVTGPASVALSGGYSLGASPAGGAWTTSNPSMAPLISYAYFVVVDTGTTVFTYTARNTCGTRSKTFTIHLPGGGGPAGVNGEVVENGTKLNVYPNPSQGTLSVNISSAVNEKATVTITNIAGQVVKEMTAMTNTPLNVTLDQPSGIYHLTAVTASGKTQVARISISN